jgi:hypothetical protein
MSEHNGHVHISAVPGPARHRGAGTRSRRRPETPRRATPWPAYIGLSFAVVGIVVSTQEFIAAGWTSSQIIGLLAAFGTLAGLQLASWGKLLKLQDEVARLVPRGVLDRAAVYKAAYVGTSDAMAGRPFNGTTGHEAEELAYRAARDADEERAA